MQKVRKWLAESNAYPDCSVIILYVLTLIELFLLFLSAMATIPNAKTISTFKFSEPKYIIYSCASLVIVLISFSYLKIKMTIIKCVSLLVLFIAFRQEAYAVPIRIIALTISVFCTLAVELQNLDISFSSKYFYNERNRINGPIYNFSMAALIILPELSSKVDWLVWLTCGLTALLIIIRLFWPYDDAFVQKTHLFILSGNLTGILCLVLRPQLQWNMVLLILGASGSIAVLIHQIFDQLRQPWNRQLKDNSAQIYLDYLMNQLKKPRISQDLREYMSKMADYARFKFPDLMVPADRLSFYNKAEWTNFIFELALNQEAEEPTNTYLFNKFILFFTIKKQWGQAVRILHQLQQNYSRMSIISKMTDGFVLSIQLMYYRSSLQSWLNQECLVRQLPFDELNQVNSIMQHAINIANGFKQLWLTLQEKQLLMNEILPKIYRIQNNIQRLKRKIDRLQFRSHYLKDAIVLFQTTIRLSPKSAAQLCKKTNYALELPQLNHDIAEIIPMTVTLNESRVGDILQLGINSAILNLNSRDNPNIQSLVPEILKDNHQARMLAYLKDGTQAQKLSDKMTVITINNRLHMAQINLKLLLHDNCIVAYGFIKIVKKHGLLLLVEELTGRIHHCNQSALDCFFDGTMPRQEKSIFKMVQGLSELRQKLVVKVEIQKEELFQPVQYNLTVAKTIELSSGEKIHLVQLAKAYVEDPIQPFRLMITGMLKNHKRQDYWTSLFDSQSVQLTNFKTSRQQTKHLKNGNILKSTATLIFLVLTILSIIIVASQYYTFYMFSTESRDRLTIFQEAILRKWFINRILLKTNVVMLTNKGRQLQQVVFAHEALTMIDEIEGSNIRLLDKNSDLQSILSSFRMLLQDNPNEQLMHQIANDSSITIDRNRDSGRKIAAESLEYALLKPSEQPAKLIGYIALVVSLLMSISIFFLIFKVEKICCQVSEAVCRSLMTMSSFELNVLISKVDNFLDYSRATQEKPTNIMSMRNTTMRLKQQDMINTDDELMRVNLCPSRLQNEPQKILYKNKISCNLSICVLLMFFTLLFLSLQITAIIYEINYTNLLHIVKEDTPLISNVEDIFTEIVEGYTYNLVRDLDSTDVHGRGYLQSWEQIAKLRTEVLNTEEFYDFAEYVAKMQYANVSTYNRNIESSNMALENMCQMMIGQMVQWKNVSDDQLKKVLLLESVNYDIFVTFNRRFYEACRSRFMNIDKAYRIIGIGTLSMSVVLLFLLLCYLVFVERKCIWRLKSLEVIQEDTEEVGEQAKDHTISRHASIQN